MDLCVDGVSKLKGPQSSIHLILSLCGKAPWGRTISNKEEGNVPGEMWVKRERAEPSLVCTVVPAPNPAFLLEARSLCGSV